MATNPARWITDGYDIHLVAPKPGDGGSRIFQLGEWFLPDGIAPWTQNNGDLIDPFRPVFQFTEAVHGVSVDNDGTLIFSGDQLQGFRDPVRNFVVSAQISATESIPIRIHRHDSLMNAEITPTQLTIHDQSTLQFTVLATFNDSSTVGLMACVADISRQPDMSWRLAAGAPGAAALVSPDGPIFCTRAGLLANVEVVLPASLYPENALPAEAERTRTATLKTVPAWETAPLPDDAAVEHLGGPGAAFMDDVPNVLFVPDGFTNRTVFHSLVADVVNKLAGQPAAAPFNSFLDSKYNAFNFWMAWLDSGEDGGIVLNELFPTSIRALSPVTAERVLPTRTKFTQTGVADVADLNFLVGLPTNAAATFNDFDTQLAIWNALYARPGDSGPIPSYLGGVTDAIWKDWKKAALRVMVRERDTALGIAIGERPRVPYSRFLTHMGWHPLRTQRADLDRYLANLFSFSKEGNRIAMGSLWTTGKDRRLVFAISNPPSERGTNTGGDNAIIAGSVTNDREAHLTQRPNLSGIADGQIPAIPDPPNVGILGMVVHELGHSFKLGDEYAQSEKVAPQGALDQVRKKKIYWNLQSDDDVRDQASQIKAAQIRWSKWPRIAAAGIVKQAPAITAGTPNHFVIQLKGSQMDFFADALRDNKITDVNILRFRLRPLVQRIASTGSDDDRNVVSPTFTLDSIDRGQNQLAAHGDQTVVNFLTNVVKPADITNGNLILFASTELEVQEQPVLHPAVGAVIENNGSFGGPFNRTATATACVLQNAPDPPMPGLERLPANVKKPAKPRRMIALFDGGNDHSCGIFHAAARCVMRQHNPGPQEDEAPPSTPPPPLDEIRGVQARDMVAPYCHVCRYILVDQLAPTAHGVIDDAYDENYPK